MGIDDRPRRLWKLIQGGGEILLLLILAASPLAAIQTSWNVEAGGTVLCNGTPMAGVRVDLMHSWLSWTPIFDTRMATTLTDDMGRYSLRGAGGSIFGPPPPYIRAAYVSQAVPPAPYPAFRIVNELDWVREDHNDTRAHPWGPGVIDMGVQNFPTIDCLLWRQSRDALSEHSTLVPYLDLIVKRWSHITGGVPFSTLDRIAWPIAYPVTGRNVFHEVGHTFRHSLDGDIFHFLVDVARFGYLRYHNPPDVTNEGFAFNEGWAIFWETLSRVPPAPLNYLNLPTNWSVEGDVAAYLRGLLDCGFSPHTLWQVLHDHPGSIHSRNEFHSFFMARFPNACKPPLPPLPSPPSACASGKISQQFFDRVVGCAGKVAQGKAAALCGKGFRLCNARELQAARRNLVPTHNYWTSDALDRDTYLSRCAARPHGSATHCGDAAMHVCVTAGHDPEGNTCSLVDCTLDPATGTEFPGNDFFGGCGTGDTTAGAVCCPEASAAALGTTEEPASEAATANAAASRSEHRAALAAKLTSLKAELAAARQRAQPPASCPSRKPCPALFALIEPALLEGAIEVHLLELARLEATPATIEEMVRQAGEQGPDAWQKTYAEHWGREILKAMSRALENAKAALQPALVQPLTAEAASAAVAELEARRREIDLGLQEPLGGPVPLTVFDPDDWRPSAQH